MKTTRFILLPIALLTLSCIEDISFGNGPGMSFTNTGPALPPGGPATFTITIEGDTTFEITGDALSLGYASYEGPGSVIYRKSISWIDTTTYYQLKCFGPNGSGILLTFSLYTTYTGKPIHPLKTGMFNGRDAGFRYGKTLYYAYSLEDPAIHQATGTTVYIDKISKERITGHFTGKYYQPDTQQIVAITGEFKDVYIDPELW